MLGTNLINLEAILEAGAEALTPFCGINGFELKLDKSDLEWESWPQTWGSTALGYGGIGGQAFTQAQTVIVSCPQFCNKVAVFFGGPRLAYLADSNSAGYRNAYEKRRMPEKSKAGQLLNERK